MSSTPLTLEEMERRIRGMSPSELDAFTQRMKQAGVLDAPWLPQIGPQTDAYYSLADETLYGGAVGGGKSDLLLGLAATAHRRSIIFRRQATDLDKLWSRCVDEILAGRVAKKDANKHKLRTTDGRFIELGHLEKPGSEKSHQGNDHDLYGFDEAAQLEEAKVLFVIQWLRSTVEGQRKRIVLATNPPVPEYDKQGNLIDAGTGAWLMEWFAPWLEDTFAYPAQPGELRWCFMRTEGNRKVTVWVDGPGAYDLESGKPVEHHTQEDINTGKVVIAKSRTFIKALLKDNMYLRDTGYAAQLSSTPEPLRTLLLTGKFGIKGEDHPMQVIPTMWVLQAQQRWRDRQAKGEFRHLKQLVLAGDIAQGGADMTVIGELLETDVFTEPTVQPGSKTPTGKEVVSLILSRRKNNALIVLDGTGGWAGSTRDKLKDDHQIDVEMHVSSTVTGHWEPGMVYKYANARAEMWWEFRLALDPQSAFDICLPPSTRLLAQLTTPLFHYKGKQLFVESKDDIRARLAGSSTDEADQILIAWALRDLALEKRAQDDVDIVERIVHGMTPAKKRAMRQQPQELDDPLAGLR